MWKDGRKVREGLVVVYAHLHSPYIRQKCLLFFASKLLGMGVAVRPRFLEKEVASLGLHLKTVILGWPFSLICEKKAFE